jgi:hypothetical protein
MVVKSRQRASSQRTMNSQMETPQGPRPSRRCARICVLCFCRVPGGSGVGSPFGRMKRRAWIGGTAPKAHCGTHDHRRCHGPTRSGPGACKCTSGKCTRYSDDLGRTQEVLNCTTRSGLTNEDDAAHTTHTVYRHICIRCSLRDAFTDSRKANPS